MAKWGTESGILRKNKPAENLEDLLVFGYACKLFRDDEKALYIDQGKHLIPWMADEKLKIDRYDCRGALSDLRKYEASREGFDAMRWLGLSESERKLEEFCDKERYYSLEINEEEEEMYKEEEKKRQNTNAIQYSYDVPKDPNAVSEEQIGPVAPEDEEEEYIPSPILDVPIDIDIPKTMKEYIRIEKTALFVCNQGTQMEILIKAKQGDNPQFSFLNQSDNLYRFYRHVLAAFKNGRYQPHVDIKKEEKQEENLDHDTSGDYLHPSLLSATSSKSEQTVPSTIPTIPYKPSANCAYSQLVNRIQGHNQTGEEKAQSQPPLPAMGAPGSGTGGGTMPQDYAQMTLEQQQYYQYYYAQQYYEYYKHMVQQQGDGAGQYQQLPSDFQQLDPSMQTYIQQMAYAHYMQQHQQQQSNNSYAQIVSNLNKDGANPYTANMPQLPPEASEITKEPVKYPLKEEEERVVTREAQHQREANEVKDSQSQEVVIKKPLLSLAAYGSGSDSESEEESAHGEEAEKVHPKETIEVYRVPSGETQKVIDKLAAYVSKNGEEFEEKVKGKGDSRFEFLNEGHEFNKYYRAKIRELKGEVEEEKEEVKEKKVEEKVESKPVRQKKIIAPVSFSIKKAKEEQPKEIKSALPVEESDDEDEENSENVAPTTNTKTNPSSVTPPSSINGATATVESSKEIDSNKEKETKTVVDYTNRGNGILDPDDPILEMLNLTASDMIKDAKRAEDKIKDKLAAAAREKLASVARDKALQLERKRKAAAFLKLKSAETNISFQTSNEKVPEKTTANKKSPKSEGGNSRRSSIEIIEIGDSISIEKGKEKERTKSKERKRASKRKDRDRSKDKERGSSKEKKKSRTPKGEEDMEDIRKEESKRKRDTDEKKEKRKKSHKRKHSKSRHESRSKKKSKKHHKRSDSSSSNSSVGS